jgi:hypothetical protein
MQYAGIDPRSGLQVYGTPDGRLWVQAHGGWAPFSLPFGTQLQQGQGAAQSYGIVEPPPPMPGASAIMRPPDLADLVREGWYRRPFYPTAPIYAKNAARVTRFYSTGVAPGDADYPAAGSTATRTIRFDTPCVLVALNGGAFPTQAGNAYPVGVGPRDCFLIDIGYGQNTEKMTIAPRLANTVVGSGERPGEVGGDGWVVNPGNVLTVAFTPLIDDLRMDITVVCLEQRGLSSFVNPAN